MTKRRFSFVASAMLVVPAIVFLVVAGQNHRLSWEYVSEWFLPNYSYLAAPHVIAIGIGLAIRTRPIAILGTLAALNFSLMSFQLYVWFGVPPRESGLAWVLYVPLSLSVLIFVPLALAWIGRRRGGSNGKQLA